MGLCSTSCKDKFSYHRGPRIQAHDQDENSVACRSVNLSGVGALPSSFSADSIRERSPTPRSTMSLKPKRVDFASTWANLKETIVGVITFSNVNRAVWNDRFSGE